MKYQIGDIVLLLHSNEEGRIVDLINDQMLMVDVKGITFPVYKDQVDFPYFKRFSEKKILSTKKEKKYIDDVFTEGHGTLYASDGRTRKDPSKKYGSGGLVQGKKYMLSLTWNAPMEAFTEKDQFFHGVGVDGVYLPFHKANQFLGMEPLPTFIANDVIKMPDVPRYTEEYRKHLVEIFG